MRGKMPRMLDPLQFVLVAVAGWMNQRQQQTIEYLREENRVLREQLGDRRVRFNDDQRRRLAVRAKGLGRKLLAEVATLVLPPGFVRIRFFGFLASRRARSRCHSREN